MSEESNQGAENQEAAAEQQEAQQTGKVFTQAEIDKIINDRLTREKSKFADYETLKEKAKKHDDLENSLKSEQQRIEEDREQWKTRASSAELDAIRYGIALEKGLTKTQAKRLVGSTPEELAADADELLKDLKATQTVPDYGQGGRGSSAPPKADANAWLRQMAGRN